WIVAESPVGKAVDVVVIRKGEELTVKVTLGRLENGDEAVAAEEDGAPSQDEPAASLSVLGMTIGELDDAARAAYGIDESIISGVVITGVEEGSAATESGVVPGTVITEIGQEAVASPSDVADRIADLKKQGRRNALLMLSSPSGELRF